MKKIRHMLVVTSCVIPAYSISVEEHCAINSFSYEIPARRELFLKATVPIENIYYRNAMADKTIFCMLKILYFKYPEAYQEIIRDENFNYYFVELNDPGILQ